MKLSGEKYKLINLTLLSAPSDLSWVIYERGKNMKIVLINANGMSGSDTCS